jgi:hypothetical protein
VARHGPYACTVGQYSSKHIHPRSQVEKRNEMKYTLVNCEFTFFHVCEYEKGTHIIFACFAFWNVMSHDFTLKGPNGFEVASSNHGGLTSGWCHINKCEWVLRLQSETRLQAPEACPSF